MGERGEMMIERGMRKYVQMDTDRAARVSVAK